MPHFRVVIVEHAPATRRTKTFEVADRADAEAKAEAKAEADDWADWPLERHNSIMRGL